jgi:hypothetical protein
MGNLSRKESRNLLAVGLWFTQGSFPTAEISNRPGKGPFKGVDYQRLYNRFDTAAYGCKR